jgi:hypothetical protein
MMFGIFIYDGVEPIDLATFGVLSMARRIRPEIEICTIAPQGGIVELASGLRVVVDYGMYLSSPVGRAGWRRARHWKRWRSFVIRQR